MASSAEGNISKALFSEGARYDGGLTPDDAERFAADFRPSWEVEEAPYAASTSEPRELEMVGMPPSARAAAAFENGHAHAVSAHPPAGRIATREPDASVIIDASPPPRSIAPPPPPAGSVPPASFHAPSAGGVSGASGAPVPSFHAPPPPPTPQFAQHPGGFNGASFGGAQGASRAASGNAGAASAGTLSKTVPPARYAAYAAGDSAEFPVKKSNKPLFIGIAGAVALAALVLGVRAATSSDPDAVAPTATAAATSHDEPSIPPPQEAAPSRSVPVVTPGSLPRAASTPVPAKPPVLTAPSQGAGGGSAHAAVLAPPAAAPRAATPPPPAPRAVVAAPPPRAPRPSPAPAPKSPPKPASGGIVRDVPF
jgi:hypothetical protein